MSLAIAFTLVALPLVLAAPTRAAPDTPDLDAVTQWNVVALEAMRAQSPLLQTRSLALVHAAMFDAANGVERRFGAYLADLRPAAEASPPAALASAAHGVLLGLFPDRRPSLDLALAVSLGALVAGPARDQGRAFGQRVAEVVLAQRANDGASAGTAAGTGYQPPPGPGGWRPTPPGHHPALAPRWGEVRPFLLADPARFAPPAPPALTSARYARELEEVKLIGRRDSPRRSPDQTAAAVFWAASASAIWSSAARQMLATRPGLALVERARALALMSGAMADAAAVGWVAKFKHGTWRPVTAIHLAADDGNDRTTADATWEPVIPTPPFPCYVSGHAITAGAAQRALTLALGDDTLDVRITHPDVGLTRRYTSLAQLAQEAHDARIWSGVHFRASQEEGLEAGRRIGEAIVASRLQPTGLSRRAPR
jgi:hypothetical protein